MVAKITGQILGIATGDSIAPASQVTITINAIGIEGGAQEIVTLTQSPSILAAFAVGQNVALYLASSSTDQTAIEGAVTVTSIDSMT